MKGVIKIRTVYDVILNYLAATDNDSHHRYKSWEHCYNYFHFHQMSKTKIDINTACLHLGFYLASWGMYRGSSFLLQKDYLIHQPVVEILLKPKYQVLWDLAPTSVNLDPNVISTLFDLKQDIVKSYTSNITLVDGKIRQVNVTDTLVTKIMLGTMGCAPAYDRYFSAGITNHGFMNIKFSPASYRELIAFYSINKNQFNSAQSYIKNKYGTYYPVMKLLDMYFWSCGSENIGFNEELDESDFISSIQIDENNESINNKLTVWDKVMEAVTSIPGIFTKADVLRYIQNKYGFVNSETVQREIYRATVNIPARVNWHPNNKPRRADTQYDMLYSPSRGQFERYNPAVHGLWEITLTPEGKPVIKQTAE